MIESVVGAVQRVRERRTTRRDLAVAETRNPGVEIFLWSRAAIWVAALFAFVSFGASRPPRPDESDTAVLDDVGYAIDIWARWDSGWFLRIAEHGYGSAADQAPAFFPLYPGIVALLGRALAGHYVLAGVIVSLAACAGAFALLYRLAEPRLGAAGARRAVLYVALFPMSLFLQAVYSESLYLLLALAAFVAAERGRFTVAGLLTGLAMLTRAAGIALLPALAVLAWRSRRQAQSLAGLAVAPLLFLAYPLGLWRQVGDPLAFVDAQENWSRSLSPAGPLGGIWAGFEAAAGGIRQLLVGSDGDAISPARELTRDHAALVDVQCFAFLLLFAFLSVVAWRRFGAPYGLFAAVSLAIPLSVPADEGPLFSLPRFGLGLFPIFLALAALGARPRLHSAMLTTSAVLLGVSIVQWALWQWVA